MSKISIILLKTVLKCVYNDCRCWGYLHKQEPHCHVLLIFGWVR